MTEHDNHAAANDPHEIDRQQRRARNLSVRRRVEETAEGVFRRLTDDERINSIEIRNLSADTQPPWEADIRQALAAVQSYDVPFEPTGIYIGNFGPALEAVIGHRGNEIVWGPDSPMIDKKLHILGQPDLNTAREFAQALDHLAAVVCPRPAPLVSSEAYLARLKYNWRILSEAAEQA